jgi:hypothetical protein
MRLTIMQDTTNFASNTKHGNIGTFANGRIQMPTRTILSALMFFLFGLYVLPGLVEFIYHAIIVDDISETPIIPEEPWWNLLNW